MTSDRPAAPLLTIKHVIPPVRADAVRRRRLENQLTETETKLTVVVAPAGWGKTSLLSGWTSSPAEPRRIAWVSLDDSDDEPVRFWTYVLAALRGVTNEISSAAVDALRVPGVGPVDLALPVLLNELSVSPVRHVLVLDDYHVLTDRRIHEAVEFLVSYLPISLRLVVVGRVDPVLPLARLRAHAELTELRTAELRFSPDEAEALVSTVAGTSLERTAVAAVWERTEGWAAGLHLAALTPLCDAALEVSGSAAVLAALERANMFVASCNGDREWYRCHGLLRDALLREAETRSGVETRGVLVRAAGWFVEHDRIDDAARHLLRAGDEAAAAELLQATDAWFFERGLAATYLALAENLTAEVVGPPLALPMAYAAAITGQHHRVVPWLDLCDARIAPDTVIEGWRIARAAALAMRAALGTPDSDPGLAVELAERALELETDAGNPRHPIARNALAGALILDGRFGEAVVLLGESWQQRDRYAWTVQVALQLAGLLGLSLLELDRGADLDRVLREAGESADEAEKAWGEAAPVVAMLRVVQGRRRHLSGDPTAARELLVRAVALAEAQARPMFLILGLVFLADAELGCGDRAAARAVLARARDIVDEEPVPPFAVERLHQAEARLGRGAARAATHSGQQEPLPQTGRDLTAGPGCRCPGPRPHLMLHARSCRRAVRSGASGADM